MTSGLGSVTTKGDNNISIDGFQLTSSVGVATTVAKSIVQPTGLGATVDVGSILVYGEIDTSQTPNYSNVDTTQTASYSDISTSQSPGFQELDAGRDAA
jgi:mRNA degradation ribonuclease J1/J2